MTAAASLPVASPSATWRTLGGLLRARWLPLSVAAATLAVASVAGLALPATLGVIVDAAIGGHAQRLPLLVAVLAGAGVLHGVLTGLGRLLVARLGEGLLARLREQVVTRLLHVPPATVERAGRGELVSRASSDVRIVGDVVLGVLPAFVSAAFAVAVTIVGLGAIDVRFALAALAAVPVQVIATRRYLRHARPLFLAARAAEGERSQRMFEAVDAAETVRAMGVSREREAVVDEAAARAVADELRAIRVSVGFWNRLNVAELVGLGAVLVVGFLLVGADAATVGGATAAALYFHALFGPIGTVLGSVDELQKAGAALARMVGVLQLPERPRRVAPPRSAAVDVVLDGVDFAYGEGFALDGVTFTVPAGQTLALVGASGAGKSTVAALVLGTLVADAGRVRVGDHDVATDAEGAVAPRVALVGQEPHVFAGTLADDLLLARPDASEADLRTALDAVGALAWADHLPEGLQTVVGAGGHALSLVEAQQLALARILLHDPDALVLDEATAAAGGERALDRAVVRVADGRTTIAIAHRLDQAARADRIVVLDHGRVVEQGRHDELVAAGGRYARLWAAWSEGRA